MIAFVRIVKNEQLAGFYSLISSDAYRTKRHKAPMTVSVTIFSSGHLSG